MLEQLFAKGVGFVMKFRTHEEGCKVGNARAVRNVTQELPNRPKPRQKKSIVAFFAHMFERNPARKYNEGIAPRSGSTCFVYRTLRGCPTRPEKCPNVLRATPGALPAAFQTIV